MHATPSLGTRCSTNFTLLSHRIKYYTSGLVPELNQQCSFLFILKFDLHLRYAQNAVPASQKEITSPKY